MFEVVNHVISHSQPKVVEIPSRQPQINDCWKPILCSCDHDEVECQEGQECAKIFINMQKRHTIVQVDQKAAELLGYKENELCGRPLRLVLGPRTDLKGLESLIDSIRPPSCPSSQSVVFYGQNTCEVERVVRATTATVLGLPACALQFSLCPQSTCSATIDIIENREPANRPCASVGVPARLAVRPFRLVRGKGLDPILEFDAEAVVADAPPFAIEDSNQGFRGLFGFRGPELVGCSLRILYGPDTDRTALVALIASAAPLVESSAQFCQLSSSPGSPVTSSRGSSTSSSSSFVGELEEEREEEEEEEGLEVGVRLYRKDGDDILCTVRAAPAPGRADGARRLRFRVVRPEPPLPSPPPPPARR